jgi:hypothetical protein
MKEFKSGSELEATILSQMNQYEAPDGILFKVVRDGDSWRPNVQVSPGVPDSAEWVAQLTQVADGLKARYDLTD